MRFATTIALVALAGSAIAAEPEGDGAAEFRVRALLDLRVAFTDNTRGWEDGGLGKTRFGGSAAGESRLVGSIAEAAVILTPQFTWDLSGYLHAAAGTQQKNGVDVIEAFLNYRPVSTGSFGYRARLGAFFPPVSLENSSLGWTSPYTISSSAINSWVGEELRTIGPEATIFHQREDLEIGLTGAIFYLNDPAGTLLAWRGWAVHDREAGLFERVPLAPIRFIGPAGQLEEQVIWEEPFHEIDDRAGYYVGGYVEHAVWGKIEALYYDNAADDHAIQGGQWAWDTTFWSLGAKLLLPGEVDLVVQGLKGSTSVITIPTPARALSYSDYRSAFALVSRDWSGHRLSLRFDVFDVRDGDLFRDNNNEHGTALTAAYVLRPTEQQRLTLEVLHVHSTRPERTLSFGLPGRVSETQLQASYRFFY